MRIVIFMAAAGWILAAGNVQAGPILTNGNFETGTLAGWTASGAVGATPNTSYHSASGASGDTGTGEVAAFGAGEKSGGVLSQSIATMAGQNYNLSFMYGAIGTNPVPQDIKVTAGDLNRTIISAPAANNLSTALASYTLPFTAAGSSTTISFADVSPVTSSVDALLDNVAVPEPASVLLLAAGAIGIAVVRRRKPTHC